MNIVDEIIKLENEIKNLPKGSIGRKIINGKTYYYNRYTENNKRIEKYIDSSKLSEYQEKIQYRKKLEKELKELKKSDFSQDKRKIDFNSNILIKDELRNYVNQIKNYKTRECFEILKDYVYSSITDKVFILYGLRRTGKTTLIRQCILNMEDNIFDKTAFIQIKSQDTLASVNKDLKKLSSLGYKYIFIDEVTLMEDFIEGAALFSDIYASMGIKVILSGTDSLGFILTKSEELYDRCILLHTTFIPYREFENVLGIKGIDEYIRYGGTMSLSGINYNQNAVFSSLPSTNEYVDTAIAKNIQHSLKHYQNGSHFRHLQELYENNELTNVINRVVEDINHRFTKEVFVKEFKSNDLSISRRNLRKDKIHPTTVLDEIDSEGFYKRLKEMLEILDKKEQTITLDNVHALEIKEYLLLLDLIYEIDERSFPNVNDIKKNIIISQPGLRYAQGVALLNSLLNDQNFSDLSLNEKNYISTRILNEIKGRMMEDIILLETKISNQQKEVFKLKFAVGEFDMVVFDPNLLCCEIYEIKYSKEIVNEQYKHLIDEEKNKLTEFKFGSIKNRYVIYRGSSTIYNGIQYINVEEYLKQL